MEGPKVVGDEVIGNAVGWKEMVVNKVRGRNEKINKYILSLTLLEGAPDGDFEGDGVTTLTNTEEVAIVAGFLVGCIDGLAVTGF